MVLPLHGGQDAQALPVFRDGSPRDVNVRGLEDADDLLVADRFMRIFLGNNLTNPLLDRLRGYLLTGSLCDAALEEILHLQDALRRMYVFVRGHPADGGFMHIDVFRHVSQDERLQTGDPLLQELDRKSVV